MTKKRDFKALVRERMTKTGERYATARARVLEKATRNGSTQPDTTAPATPGVLAGYGPCGGVQSETSVMANAFRHAGLRGPGGAPMSEAFVLGQCGGIGFMYAVFEYKGHLPMLTITTRSRSMPDTFAAEGFDRVGANITVHQTASDTKAKADLDAALDAGQPALCTVDAAALPYYGIPAELMGMGPHIVGVIGRDGDDYWLDDRGVNPIRVGADQLAKARGAYRKAKHAMRVVGAPHADSDRNLADLARQSLQAAVRLYDEPPVAAFASNVGTAGLRKWAELLTHVRDKKGWPTVFAAGPAAYAGLRRVYDCVQHDYTAPDASRPMFADWLDQAGPLTGLDLAPVAIEFREIGKLWNAVAERIATAGDKALERACANSDRRAELLDTRGADAADEMGALWRERVELADRCELTADRAHEICQDLASLVTEIADRERAAMDRLAAVAC